MTANYQITNITLFPEMFNALHYGITGRAIERGLLELQHINPRDFTTDKHQTVDDRPYGGGPGMVMLYQPLAEAIHQAKQQLPTAKVVHLSPQGSVLKQQHIQALAKEDGLILLSSRYEGVDQRLIDDHVDIEYSLGDYVLSGGEIAAMAMIDAICRLLPGALGHELSAAQDSFSDGLLDCPHYTRPETIAGKTVPEVLLSGDHQAIAECRLATALGRTLLLRPDLLAARPLTNKEKTLLNTYLFEHGLRKAP